MEVLSSCPLCNSKNVTAHLSVPDHFLSREKFQLQRCNDCTLVFTNPRPAEHEIGKYYKSEEYISHSNKVNSLSDVLYRLVRSYTLKAKYRLLKSYIKQDRVNHLDYGCGTGHFIQYTSSQGWNSIGYEPDANARKSAGKSVKELIYSNLNKIFTHKFDIISLFHVLEHVHELQTMLSKFTEHLNSNGILVLALPNHKSFDAQYYKTEWAGYDVPRHLYHFNQTSLDYLANQYGLKIESTHPMIFDSFYVSMLSEKYKESNLQFLKGMWKGLQSNLSAKKTGEYSSLIYVLRKV